MGEAKLGPLRVNFDRRLKLEFHGIAHPGGAEMAATLIGVTGCTTAVPLNPAYTVGEFAIHLHDRGVNALIVEACMDTPARDAAERLGIPVLEVELVDNSVAGNVALRPGPEQMARQPGPATSDDLALVLATSGTTSHSKIVPRHHRHLNVRAAIHKKIYGLRDDDRLLNLQPLYLWQRINSLRKHAFFPVAALFSCRGSMWKPSSVILRHWARPVTRAVIRSNTASTRMLPILRKRSGDHACGSFARLRGALSPI